MTVILGLDPGMSQKSPGGIAAIAPNGTAQTWPIPADFLDIVEMLKPFEGAIAAIESVHMWTQDCETYAAFRLEKLFRHHEKCLCAINLLKIDYVLVEPNVWKSNLGLTGEGESFAISRAIALYPECRHSIYRKSRNGRVKTFGGCAAALLIAEYRRVQLLEDAA